MLLSLKTKLEGANNYIRLKETKEIRLLIDYKLSTFKKDLECNGQLTGGFNWWR